jgi:MraZ protein
MGKIMSENGCTWRAVDKSGDKPSEMWITMFLGEYQYSIDEKKRLAIPTKFRQKLGKKAVITRGLDNCLFLYPLKEWEKLAEKLSKLPISQADARGFSRIMLAGAMEVDLDALGRILVPDYLKQYASLNKKVIVAGLYNRVEIWDEDKWNHYKQQTESEAGNIAERLKELGV